jgi:hypothetical protein
MDIQSNYNTQIYLKRNNKLGRVTPPGYKSYYVAGVMKTMCYKPENRQIIKTE